MCFASTKFDDDDDSLCPLFSRDYLFIQMIFLSLFSLGSLMVAVVMPCEMISFNFNEILRF
jgi:hypothetical protein